MNRILNYLLNELKVRKIVENEERLEKCRMGLELILSEAINFSLVLAGGIVTKTLRYSIIYLFLLWSVRKFSGGFHAKTYLLCRIVTVGTYVCVLAFDRIHICGDIRYIILFNIISVITMILFAPIRHPNKDLTDNEVTINKIFSVTSTLVFSVISIILVSLHRKEGEIISITLLAITVLMYVGKIANRKEAQLCEIK